MSPMLRAGRVCAILCSLTALSVGSAQSQTANAVPDLIGADVLATDGTVVGEVAAITMGADGDFAEIRIAVESPLGNRKADCDHSTNQLHDPTGGGRTRSFGDRCRGFADVSVSKR